MKHNRTILVIAVLALLFCSCWVAFGTSQEKPNLPEVKKGIELFESVLNQSLAQTFGGPFETLNRVQGAYVPGYGAVFSFEISLTPFETLGPFSPAPTQRNEQAHREEEARRRQKAKGVAEDTLGNYSQALAQLAPSDSIAIVIHAVAVHPGRVERSTIVISADKKLLDARQSRALDQAHFVEKLSITEY